MPRDVIGRGIFRQHLRSALPAADLLEIDQEIEHFRLWHELAVLSSRRVPSACGSGPDVASTTSGREILTHFGRSCPPARSVPLCTWLAVGARPPSAVFVASCRHSHACRRVAKPPPEQAIEMGDVAEAGGKRDVNDA